MYALIRSLRVFDAKDTKQLALAIMDRFAAEPWPAS
jgi:hypothetical protein